MEVTYNKKHKVELPENFDPKDQALKKYFNVDADDINFISMARKYPYLACGAVRKGKPCGNPAGSGTDHVGRGRCKLHGGKSTGPKTEEGKAAVSQNGTIHGFYSKALFPKEREIFDQLQGEDIGLEFEIRMLKAKILNYLAQSADKWEDAYNYAVNRGDMLGTPEEYADYKTRKEYVTIKEGEEGEETTSKMVHYYQQGQIDDKPLIRALETLGRLVDKHAKLKGVDKTDAENILDGINRELRAASYGQVSMSWGGKAQQKTKSVE